jgi:chitinase
MKSFFSKIMMALLLASFQNLITLANSKRIIGYYTSWSIYGRNYHIQNIPADKITHINYAFANINGTTNEIMLGDSYADIDRFYPGDSWDPDSLRGCFHQLLILKANHPDVKTLISVGGWTWSTYFSNVALTPLSRATFSASCMEFIDEYGFDGIDIDWEYPVSGGLPTVIHRPEDRRNFTLLMAELHRQLDSLEIVNSQQYFLSIAAPAGPANIANIEVDSISQYLDWINVMTYDFHGPWGGLPDAVTNFNSPLFLAPDDPLPEPYHSQFNLDSAMDTYLALGVPNTKLHSGLAFYGRGFGSVANTNNGLFAPYNGPCWQGTWEAGVFDYWDLAEHYINIAGYVSYWHNSAKVPWLFNPSTQVMISYDDTVSIEEKGDYILDNDLAGTMFWEFSADRDSVLLRTVYDELKDSLQINIRYNNPLTYPTYISIPTNGGNLNFTATISNFTTSIQHIQVWIMARLPNGNWIGPMLGPINLNLSPNSQLVRIRTQTVPASAPGGTYLYEARLGDYPNDIIDCHGFLFTKVGAWDNGSSDWNNTGEDLASVDACGVAPNFKVNAIKLSISPNPFNYSINIRFDLPKMSQVNLEIYDINGRKVWASRNQSLAEGNNVIIWEGKDFQGNSVGSGIYFARLNLTDDSSRESANFIEKIVMLE